MKKALILTLSLLLINSCKKEETPTETGTEGSTKTAKPTAEKVVHISIGTGSQTGVYYPTGMKLSEMVNSKKSKFNLTAKTMAGSVDNVQKLLSNDIQFGIVQSDIHYQAYKGEGKWDGKPQSKLRSVFAIYPEVVTLVSRDDAGIKKLADLKGKKVNIGAPKSGQRENAKSLLKFIGIDYKKDLTAEGLSAGESPSSLQDGKIDAYFFTVGHPNSSLSETTAGKHKIRIVELTGLEDYIKKNPWFTKSTILKSQYPKLVNETDIESIAVKATLMTTEDVPEELVYLLTKTVFENFDSFKKSHPAYATLTKESMLEGITAPLHPGAEKYFKESGLIK
ncbi:MAG: TAXI family TRAP transporter solute-binding subunit [Lentisphaeria bacterium]|nr:TAXI family TRAP transporter solute-binding subunit [Lentisphaeria bacterium]NQZ69215.1 TAXI family TRAP transporter solute-binding subunit [Lentisphaeria bacterium]